MIVVAMMRAFSGSIGMDEVLEMRIDVVNELLAATTRVNELAAKYQTRPTGDGGDAGGNRFRITSLDDIRRLKGMTGGVF